MGSSRGKQENFSGRLVSARSHRGLSQAEVAERTGLMPSAISHFETGTRKPSFDNLRRLADALQVSTDYLLGRTDDMEGTVAPSVEAFRNFKELTADDQEFASEILEKLAERSRRRSRKDP